MTEVGNRELELRALLDAWADGIGRHEPSRVAELFTEDALFQGFDPAPGFGRAYIAAYCDKQPIGMTASYELMSVQSLTPDLTLAYASVKFVRPEGVAPVYLTAVAERVGGTLLLRHYHVSHVLGA